jgi:sulfite reductase beta subunit-like hemoprotein
MSLPGPRLARPGGIIVKTEDAFDVAVASAEIHRDYGNRESKSKARFKWLIEEWGLEKFVKELEEKLGKSFERYNGPVFKGSSDHEGIGSQGQEQFHYVNIPMLGGRLTVKEMRGIADLADKYGHGELRLTTTQNIIIPFVKDLDTLTEQLKEMGYRFDGSRIRWNSLGCSSDFCGKTRSPHAKEALNLIVDHLEHNISQELLDEASFRIHVNGCPNYCCPSHISEIGLNGKQVRVGDEVKQTYDILLGGSFGLTPTFGKTIVDKVPFEELKVRLVTLFNHYEKDKELSESLYSFCNRHTAEELSNLLSLKGE